MIEIVVPWVPTQECNPNNHHNSERTKIRHRKAGAVAAGYPMKAVAPSEPITEPVQLDITIRWGYRQRSWDSDNIVTACKYLRDALQTHQIVANDNQVRIGEIVQERAKEQPETILRIMEVTR